MSRPAKRRSTASPSACHEAEPTLLWSYPWLACQLARALTLAGIVYAAWRFGATDTVALSQLSIVWGLAACLALTCRQTYQSTSHRLPIVFFALISIWVGYAVLQSTSIAKFVPTPFHGVLEVQQRWASEPIASVSDAIERLGEQRSAPEATDLASVLPEETRYALTPFLLAGAVAMLAAILFNTRQSRRVFLWVMIANASALACWGIIQKASGGQHILPGVENTFSSGMPFASFVYKNAGAAALLPALAAIAAMFYGESGNRNRSRWSRGDGNTSSINALLLDTRNMALFSLAILIAVGLVASLSRGAWLAAALAAIVVGLMTRSTVHRRDHLLISSSAGVMMLVVILTMGLGKGIRQRAEQVSLDHTSSDLRWPQWVDGFSTALTHFPAGSGLGTYGYASLPHLSSARSHWFREAHNQYLEVLTESGLIGVMVLFIGIAWFATVSWRLWKRRIDREKRSWGLIGIAILICGGIQSAFDFVLVIPANLILYASLIGITATVHRSTSSLKSRQQSADPAFQDASQLSGSRWRWAESPAAWCVVAMLFILASYHVVDEQTDGDRALVATRVSVLEQEPSQETVNASIVTLNEAIDQRPGLSALYLRRCEWHLAAYRLRLLQAARDEGIAAHWDDTRLEKLFGILSSQDPLEREVLMAGLRATPAMRSLLADALTDLATSLSLNPLSPRGHLCGCALAPLTDMPVTPWLVSSSALASSSVDYLYLSGLFAFQSDELDLAVDQWSKSLAINHTYLDSIFELSRQKLSSLQIATQLLPTNRLDLCVRLVQTSGGGSSEDANPNPGNDTSPDRELAESIMQYLQSDSSGNAGRKHAAIAQIRALLGDFDAAAQSWKAAVKVDSRNANYRWEYSRSLSRLGKNDEALHQSVLGQTLNPVDRRFVHLSTEIRREIRLGSGL